MNPVHSLVGAWRMHAPSAPFPHHMVTFHADGTLLQSNPDADSSVLSDSAGMGIWRVDVAEPDRVLARFAEVSIDHAAPDRHRYTEVTLRLTVRDDTFTGQAHTESYHLRDSNSPRTAGRSTIADVSGTRVRLPDEDAAGSMPSS